ncbi:MAG: dodecin family protein [Acidimicrobiales bacterium]
MNSVYNVIELIGSSSESWEKATANAIAEAAKTLRDLRVAEVTEMDVLIEDGKVLAYRSKVRLSFKHEVGELEP